MANSESCLPVQDTANYCTVSKIVIMLKFLKLTISVAMPLTILPELNWYFYSQLCIIINWHNHKKSNEFVTTFSCFLLDLLHCENHKDFRLTKIGPWEYENWKFLCVSNLQDIPWLKSFTYSDLMIKVLILHITLGEPTQLKAWVGFPKVLSCSACSIKVNSSNFTSVCTGFDYQSLETNICLTVFEIFCCFIETISWNDGEIMHFMDSRYTTLKKSEIRSTSHPH
jgi:hypothetical protein